MIFKNRKKSQKINQICLENIELKRKIKHNKIVKQ